MSERSKSTVVCVPHFWHAIRRQPSIDNFFHRCEGRAGEWENVKDDIQFLLFVVCNVCKTICSSPRNDEKSRRVIITLPFMLCSTTNDAEYCKRLPFLHKTQRKENGFMEKRTTSETYVLYFLCEMSMERKKFDGVVHQSNICTLFHYSNLVLFIRYTKSEAKLEIMKWIIGMCWNVFWIYGICCFRSLFEQFQDFCDLQNSH